MTGRTERGVAAVVFDLDGTLIDSCRDIASAANHALGVHGWPARSLEQLRSFIGDGARALMARAAGLATDDGRLGALLHTFEQHYAAHPVVHTSLLAEAREAVELLSDLPRAVCTNKPRAITLRILESLEFASPWACVVAGGDTPEVKPHPAPLLKLAAELGVSPSALVMVGDGPQDIACAHAVGARSIGVTTSLIVHEARLAEARPTALLAWDQVVARIRQWAGSEITA